MKSKKTVKGNGMPVLGFLWRHKVWALIGIMTLVAVSITGCLYMREKSNTDEERLKFTTANLEKQQVFGQLVGAIGQSMLTEEKNICYNSERGPFDNGRLWCQVASAAHFSRQVPQSEIEGHMRKILSDDHLLSKDSSSLEFMSSKGLTCKLLIYDGRLSTSTPYFFSDVNNSAQTIVLICLDRAIAKHYPYIN